MAKFITIVGHRACSPPTTLNQPSPDPQMFGLPIDDDGSRDDVLLGRTSSVGLTTSRTSTRCARHRRASSWRPARNRTASWPAAPRKRLPSGSVDSCPVPGRPRRLLWRRVRPDGQARRVRRQAARGPGGVGCGRRRSCRLRKSRAPAGLPAGASVSRQARAGGRIRVRPSRPLPGYRSRCPRTFRCSSLARAPPRTTSGPRTR